MNTSTTPQPEALTIVELEERFETTIAALDAARCNGNHVKVSV